VLSARLAAEGVVYEVRGPSGAYPFGAAKVFVLRSDLEAARLLDDVHQLGESERLDDGPRRRSPVVVTVAVVMVTVIVLSIVASAVRVIFG
jgi:hypothetical protein